MIYIVVDISNFVFTELNWQKFTTSGEHISGSEFQNRQQIKNLIFFNLNQLRKLVFFLGVKSHIHNIWGNFWPFNQIEYIIITILFHIFDLKFLFLLIICVFIANDWKTYHLFDCYHLRHNHSENWSLKNNSFHRLKKWKIIH